MFIPSSFDSGGFSKEQAATSKRPPAKRPTDLSRSHSNIHNVIFCEGVLLCCNSAVALKLLCTLAARSVTKNNKPRRGEQNNTRSWHSASRRRLKLSEPQEHERMRAAMTWMESAPMISSPTLSPHAPLADGALTHDNQNGSLVLSSQARHLR